MGPNFLIVFSCCCFPTLLLAAPAHVTGEPPPHPYDPTPDLWLISTWLGFGGAQSSDATVDIAGSPSSNPHSDFGSLFVIGVRGEFYPDFSGPVAKHFGFAIELNGMFGEFEIENRPGAPSDGVTFASGIATPGLAIRFPGKRWEGYFGAGPTVMWWSYVDSVDLGTSNNGYDSDFEIPFGVSAYTGLRHHYSREWMFMMEAKYQTGKNSFELGQPRTEIDVDWATMQFVIGFTYKY